MPVILARDTMHIAYFYFPAQLAVATQGLQHVREASAGGSGTTVTTTSPQKIQKPRKVTNLQKLLALDDGKYCAFRVSVHSY